MRCALIRATQTSRGVSDFSCKDGVARDAASYSMLLKGDRTFSARCRLQARLSGGPALSSACKEFGICS